MRLVGFQKSKIVNHNQLENGLSSLKSTESISLDSSKLSFWSLSYSVSFKPYLSYYSSSSETSVYTGNLSYS